MPPGSGSGGITGGSGGTGGTIQPTPLVLDSGRTVLRRLNRTEYTLTVQDLLGTAAAGEKLPDDQIADGFDTVGEHLAFTPLFAEALEASAGAAVDELFALPATDARRKKVFVCTLQAGSEATCARQILTAFTRRAYRRPATTAEINGLMALVDKVRNGATYNDGLKAAINAVLLLPQFIYRAETSVGLASAPGASAKPLNSFELATRLSYFLWSTMPDDELAASADSNKLVSDPAELPAQVERMLKHEKGSALVTNFGARWLSLPRVETIHFEPSLYPAFDDSLRVAAQEETSTFFARLVGDNLPLATLINADFTYANARLGRHYGLTVSGDRMVRVSLAGTQRAGLLTQASVLMVNSHPDRTSPVVRGNWILERILCAETPPPPDNVPDLPPSKPGTTGRQLLEDHRKNPVCGTCHNLIDPLGLGLENYDAIGAYRTMDNGGVVDSSGVYPSVGTAFSGGVELARLIAQDPRYPACVTQHLLTYGVGRAFSPTEARTYAKALAERGIAGQNGNWRSWIAMITSSEAFRTNRPDPK